ncbi:MAG UNVERIFIED_CONTAM: hypothetical protein LVR29_13165 [Microcystis novacekii LVE1205-3]
MMQTLLETGHYSEDEKPTISAIVQQLIKLYYQEKRTLILPNYFIK